MRPGPTSTEICIPRDFGYWSQRRRIFHLFGAAHFKFHGPSHCSSVARISSCQQLNLDLEFNSLHAQREACEAYIKSQLHEGYRYYVSQAILGSRPSETGQVGRVSAPDIEALIEVNLRKRFAGLPGQSLGMADLVEAHLERVVILADAVELRLTDSQKTGGQTERLEWRRQPHSAEKGPVVSAVLDSRPDARVTQTVLAAIGKARLWTKELTDGGDVAAIARREVKSERHIRLLLPLAFVPPATVRDIISGNVEPHSVTDLAKDVSLTWRNLRQSSTRT